MARPMTSPAEGSPIPPAWWRRSAWPRRWRPTAILTSLKPAWRQAMKTVLYLIRHGATEANLARPPILHGRKYNPPLAPLGIRQAEATRDFLAIRPLEHCYSSPLRRALQTAEIVATPHGLSPLPIPALTECDIGRWDGLDWQTIRSRDGEAYRHFME